MRSRAKAPRYGLRHPIRDTTLAHRGERRLEQIAVRLSADFLARLFDEFLLQFILGGNLLLKVDAKGARPGFFGQGKSSRHISHVVLGLVDDLESSPLAGIAGIESALVELDTLAEDLDHGKAIMLDRPLVHLHHVLDLRRMRAGHESRPAGEKLAHGIGRAIEGPPGIGLRLEARRRSGRSLLLRQTVDEVVHDDIGHAEVLAAGMIEMVAANGKTVAIAAKHEHVQIVTAQADSRSERQRAAVDEVAAVRIDEIRKARRTADAGQSNDILLGQAELFDGLVVGGQDGEVAATRTPSRMVRRQAFFR